MDDRIFRQVTMAPNAKQEPLRRKFLQLGLALPALPGAAWAYRGGARLATRCIFVEMTGGPSQLDTFDPKPEAPSQIRSRFGARETAVAGMQMTELFPRLAREARHFSIVRGMHYAGAADHATGQALLQQMRLAFGGEELLAFGGEGLPLPEGEALHGKAASRFGEHAFGQRCAMAVEAMLAGPGVVRIPMFAGVYDQPSWDAHGYRPFADFAEYEQVVAPRFDQGFAALLASLAAEGLLEETVVVAAGEFGRSPERNSCGGRDHWPEAYSILVAGGPFRRGEVFGSTDANGGEPRDLPVTPQQMAATLRAVSSHSQTAMQPEGEAAAPVWELLR